MAHLVWPSCGIGVGDRLAEVVAGQRDAREPQSMDEPAETASGRPLVEIPLGLRRIAEAGQVGSDDIKLVIEEGYDPPPGK